MIGESYHGLRGECLDLLDRTRGSLPERSTVQLHQLSVLCGSSIHPFGNSQPCFGALRGHMETYSLVHVNSVLASDDVRDGGALRLARSLLG